MSNGATAHAQLVADLQKKTALVLSAGAPNAALLAGALCRLHEKGVRFPRIYASGGGAVIALALIAPKDRAPTEALEHFVDAFGIDDSIYKVFPVGYKTFFKHGPYTRMVRDWSALFKLGGSLPDKKFAGVNGLRTRYENLMNAQVYPSKPDQSARFKRLYNDWIDLASAAITPLLTTPGSKGLCAPFPLVEELVDFERLNAWRGKLYIPAYNLSEKDPSKKIRQFTNRPVRDEKPITADAVRASLAAPFFYPPVEIDGELYIEAAFKEPFNEDYGWLKHLADGEIRNLLIIDILGTEEIEERLIHEPRNLWDAFGLSIMLPIIEQAQTTRRLLASLANSKTAPAGVKNANWMPPVRFFSGQWGAAAGAPESTSGGIMDWSHGNLRGLFKRGKDTADEYLKSTPQNIQELLWLAGHTKPLTANLIRETQNENALPNKSLYPDADAYDPNKPLWVN